MSSESNKAIVRETNERGINQGDLSAWDRYHTNATVDHQEPPGTPFLPHIKDVFTRMRAAFPDLHFEIAEILAEGDLVAWRAVMTGTQQGAFQVNPATTLPATGRRVSVPHLYLVRIVNGKVTDLWHTWDIPGMMRQLGLTPEAQGRPA